MEIEKTLVVCAHPDDEVLGCGGTLARLIDEGHEVDVAILGEGITSRYKNRKDADHSLVKKLQSKSREVAEFLGVNKLYLEELPDNRFDSFDLLDIVKIVERIIDQSRAEIIYTHSTGDLNIDHRIVHQAVLTATRPVPDQTVKEIYAFEVPSSTEWAFGEMDTPFNPKQFVDISDYLDQKIKSMEYYDSEVAKFPHPRSPEAIRALAQFRGSQSGYRSAEAFEVIRLFR